TSIISGQIITRTGRYKAFPIAGTAIAVLGMWLLSSLSETTGSGIAALHMLVLGLGLGLVMQVLVLATPDAVPYAQLGVATSAAGAARSRRPSASASRSARRSTPTRCVRSRVGSRAYGAASER